MKHGYILLVIMVLSSCSIDSATKNPPETGIKPDSSMTLNYAKGFSVDYFRGYKEIKVKDPWSNEITVYKVGDDTTSSIGVPSSIFALSSTHLGMLNVLELQAVISGVSSKLYVYDSILQDRISKGAIAEMGSTGQLNVEQTIALSPGWIMISGFETASPNVQLLEASGIPVIKNYEWKETFPLARAEWLKFVAAFFNKENEANVIFSKIEKEYTTVTSQLKFETSIDQVMIGINYKGTWHTPGGNSFLAQTLADAGVNYKWKDDTLTGSIPLSLEVVIEQHLQDSLWINPGQAQSLEQLLEMDNRYGDFRAFKEGSVYNFYNRLNGNGANDYWESGVVNPHIILKDYVKIFHPTVLPNHELYYYARLN